MRGNKKESIPQGKKYVVIPKRSFKAYKEFLEVHKDIYKELLGIRRQMNEEIEKRVAEKYGGTIHTMEAFRDFAVIAVKLMKEKGLLSHEEIDKILDNLKEKGIGDLLR